MATSHIMQPPPTSPKKPAKKSKEELEAEAAVLAAQRASERKAAEEAADRARELAARAEQAARDAAAAARKADLERVAHEHANISAETAARISVLREYDLDVLERGALMRHHLCTRTVEALDEPSINAILTTAQDAEYDARRAAAEGVHGLLALPQASVAGILAATTTTTRGHGAATTPQPQNAHVVSSPGVPLLTSPSSSSGHHHHGFNAAFAAAAAAISVAGARASRGSGNAGGDSGAQVTGHAGSTTGACAQIPPLTPGLALCTSLATLAASLDGAAADAVARRDAATAQRLRGHQATAHAQIAARVDALTAEALDHAGAYATSSGRDGGYELMMHDVYRVSPPPPQAGDGGGEDWSQAIGATTTTCGATHSTVGEILLWAPITQTVHAAGGAAISSTAHGGAHAASNAALAASSGSGFAATTTASHRTTLGGRLKTVKSAIQPVPFGQPCDYVAALPSRIKPHNSSAEQTIKSEGLNGGEVNPSLAWPLHHATDGIPAARTAGNTAAATASDMPRDEAEPDALRRPLRPSSRPRGAGERSGSRAASRGGVAQPQQGGSTSTLDGFTDGRAPTPLTQRPAAGAIGGNGRTVLSSNFDQKSTMKSQLVVPPPPVPTVTVDIHKVVVAMGAAVRVVVTDYDHVAGPGTAEAASLVSIVDCSSNITANTAPRSSAGANFVPMGSLQSNNGLAATAASGSANLAGPAKLGRGSTNRRLLTEQLSAQQSGSSAATGAVTSRTGGRNEVATSKSREGQLASRSGSLKAVASVGGSASNGSSVGPIITLDILAMPPPPRMLRDGTALTLYPSSTWLAAGSGGNCVSVVPPAATPLQRLSHPAANASAAGLAQALKLRVRIPMTVVVPPNPVVGRWSSVDRGDCAHVHPAGTSAPSRAFGSALSANRNAPAGVSDGSTRSTCSGDGQFASSSSVASATLSAPAGGTGSWVTDGVHDASFDAESRLLAFSTVATGPHALLVPATIDLPYRSWVVYPVPISKRATVHHESSSDADYSDCSDDEAAPNETIARNGTTNGDADAPENVDENSVDGTAGKRALPDQDAFVRSTRTTYRESSAVIAFATPRFPCIAVHVEGSECRLLEPRIPELQHLLYAQPPLAETEQTRTQVHTREGAAANGGVSKLNSGHESKHFHMQATAGPAASSTPQHGLASSARFAAGELSSNTTHGASGASTKHVDAHVDPGVWMTPGRLLAALYKAGLRISPSDLDAETWSAESEASDAAAAEQRRLAAVAAAESFGAAATPPVTLLSGEIATTSDGHAPAQGGSHTSASDVLARGGGGSVRTVVCGIRRFVPLQAKLGAVENAAYDDIARLAAACTVTSSAWNANPSIAPAASKALQLGSAAFAQQENGRGTVVLRVRESLLGVDDARFSVSSYAHASDNVKGAVMKATSESRTVGFLQIKHENGSSAAHSSKPLYTPPGIDAIHALQSLPLVPHSAWRTVLQAVDLEAAGGVVSRIISDSERDGLAAWAALATVSEAIAAVASTASTMPSFTTAPQSVGSGRDGNAIDSAAPAPNAATDGTVVQGATTETAGLMLPVGEQPKSEFSVPLGGLPNLRRSSVASDFGDNNAADFHASESVHGTSKPNSSAISGTSVTQFRCAPVPGASSAHAGIRAAITTRLSPEARRVIDAASPEFSRTLYTLLCAIRPLSFTQPPPQPEPET